MSIVKGDWELDAACRAAAATLRRFQTTAVAEFRGDGARSQDSKNQKKHNLETLSSMQGMPK